MPSRLVQSARTPRQIGKRRPRRGELVIVANGEPDFAAIADGLIDLLGPWNLIAPESKDRPLNRTESAA